MQAIGFGIRSINEFDTNPSADNSKQKSDELLSSLDLFDPRYGYLKTELIEFVTDEYYGNQKRVVQELGLIECPQGFANEIDVRRSVCVRFLK